MADVSESVVHEFLEEHGMLVRQYRKSVAPAGRDDDDPDLLVVNPAPQPKNGPLPFVLGAGDLAFIERAVIVIKAWHTEVFSPPVLTSNPGLFRFLQRKAFQQAVHEFSQNGTPLKIMVVPALPQDAQLRAQSLEIIKANGLDAVLPFRTCLAELVARIEPNRNFQKSDLFQTLRILKNYGLFRDAQMELFKAGPRKGKKASP